MNIRIEYDGKRPCLCMGHLIVWIANKKELKKGENKMTQEDKELLLRDLSARLAYGVRVDYKEG